jgi:hypothetical protein
MVRVYSSRNPWTSAAAAFDFCILPSSFFLPRVFHPKTIEQRALGLLLAGCDFDLAANEMGSKRRSALFHFAVRPTSGLTHSHDADFN